MAKLDNGRKFALIFIAIAGISIAMMSQPQPSPTAAAPATPPVVASATPPTAVAPVTPPVAAPAVPAAQPAPTTQSFAKFFVYQDNINHNHYVLSGLMPSGNCIKINNFWKDNCQAGQRCLQITYDVACSGQEQGWAGAYWLEPANNWGDQKGGYDLTGAQRLVFWARGERGGEIIDSFKVGGVVGGGHKFPDSDTASIGPVTLTKEWQQYSIDLKGKDLSYIVGGFAWVANAQANPQAITFYLDDIYYE